MYLKEKRACDLDGRSEVTAMTVGRSTQSPGATLAHAALSLTCWLTLLAWGSIEPQLHLLLLAFLFQHPLNVGQGPWEPP